MDELSHVAKQAFGDENSITEIRKFFEEDAQPLKSNEFVEFWKSLSEEDKIEFRTAQLREMSN